MVGAVVVQRSSVSQRDDSHEEAEVWRSCSLLPLAAGEQKVKMNVP